MVAKQAFFPPTFSTGVAYFTLFDLILVSSALLGTAMAAVGLSTHSSVFKGVGPKPFAVGFTGALLVACMGFVVATYFGPHIRLQPAKQLAPADSHAEEVAVSSKQAA